MPNKTTNYNLNKPTTNENVDISVLNDNMDIIDAELAKKSEFSGSYNDLSDKPTIPDISGKANKPATATVTMSASRWSNGTYSFEGTYPVATYDIEIALDSTATSVQVEAFNGALIVGSSTANIVKAYGDIPTVDIPVIIKAVIK